MKYTESQISKISKDLQNKIKGKVLSDPFSRGRYSTDSSLYQITPLGAVLPKDQNDVLNLMEYSQKNAIPLLARGGGSSQCGQTVSEAIVLDYSKHQNKVLELNVEEKYVWVQPGVVLDSLNKFLQPYGLWFPVDEPLFLFGGIQCFAGRRQTFANPCCQAGIIGKPTPAPFEKVIT